MNNLIKNTSVALLIAALFFTYNYALISKGHFHEDAYILFIYVENFINGNGITYFPGGQHIEGATDFLWLVMLILLGKLGMDTGSSVIFLNSIGAFIISFILSNEILTNKIKDKSVQLFLVTFIFLWIFQTPLYAAVGGFSVFMYMSLVLLAFLSVHKEKYIIYTPYISLVIAIFRPDGVIIGVGFTIIGIYKAYKKN